MEKGKERSKTGRREGRRVFSKKIENLGKTKIKAESKKKERPQGLSLCVHMKYMVTIAYCRQEVGIDPVLMSVHQELHSVPFECLCGRSSITTAARTDMLHVSRDEE